MSNPAPSAVSSDLWYVQCRLISLLAANSHGVQSVRVEGWQHFKQHVRAVLGLGERDFKVYHSFTDGTTARVKVDDQAVFEHAVGSGGLLSVWVCQPGRPSPPLRVDTSFPSRRYPPIVAHPMPRLSSSPSSSEAAATTSSGSSGSSPHPPLSPHTPTAHQHELSPFTSSVPAANATDSQRYLHQLCAKRDGYRCVFTDELYDRAEDVDELGSSSPSPHSEAGSPSNPPSTWCPEPPKPLKNSTPNAFHAAHILYAAESNRKLPSEFVQYLKTEHAGVYDEYKGWLKRRDDRSVLYRHWIQVYCMPAPHRGMHIYALTSAVSLSRGVRSHRSCVLELPHSEYDCALPCSLTAGSVRPWRTVMWSCAWMATATTRSSTSQCRATWRSTTSCAAAEPSAVRKTRQASLP